MEPILIKKIRNLKVYILLLTVLNLVILFSAFRDKIQPTKFEEIDAERINILGDNGKPVMVLSGKKRIPGPRADGKDYSPEIIDGRKYFAGMLFFNEVGDEVGGLIYTGIKKDSVNYSQVVHLSFDQWKQNQVVGLDYNDNGKSRYAGLRIWDRPTNVPMSKQLDLLEAMVKNKQDDHKVDSIRKILVDAQNKGENGVERMFIGSKNEVAQIQLKDKKGNVRAKLYVDTDGSAKLDFLDAAGKVTKTIAE
jgi:hypothetical protein